MEIEYFSDHIKITHQSGVVNTYTKEEVLQWKSDLEACFAEEITRMQEIDNIIAIMESA